MWSRNKLPTIEDVDFLEKLKNSGYSFIFTFFNLIEAVQYENMRKVSETANFMENLNYQWILTSHERKILEINNIKCQLLHNKNILSDEFPFTKDFTKLIMPTADAVILNDFIRAKSILEKINILKQFRGMDMRNENLARILPIWMDQNKNAQKQHPTGQMHKEAVKTLYNNKLAELIISNPNKIQIEPNKLEQLLTHIKENNVSIPSFTIQFYIEHEMLRNTNMKWESNDIADLEQSTVIPYTALTVLDKNFYSFVKQTIRKYPQLYNDKNHLVAGSIKELRNNYRKFNKNK